MTIPTHHRVKSWPIFFGEIERHQKLHDLRRDDRDYKVGDHLVLYEYDPVKQEETGRTLVRRISYITRPDGAEACAYSPQAIRPGFVILSLTT